MEGLLGMVGLGVIIPVLVSASVLSLFLAVGRRRGSALGKRRVGLGVAFGLGLGALAGSAGVFLPSWPPLDVTDRLPFLLLVSLVPALIDAFRPAVFGLTWLNRIALTALTLAALLGPAFEETWKTPPILLRGALLATVLVLSWANLDALTTRLSGASVFLPLLVVMTGASVVLVLSGNLILGRLCGALTAALGGCWAVSWRVPSVSLERGANPILVASLAGLLLVGHFYGELTRSCALLIVFAPATLWITQLGPLQRRGPWLRTIVATLVVLVPTAIAVGLAVAAMPSYEY